METEIRGSVSENKGQSCERGCKKYQYLSSPVVCYGPMDILRVHSTLCAFVVLFYNKIIQMQIYIWTDMIMNITLSLRRA